MTCFYVEYLCHGQISIKKQFRYKNGVCYKKDIAQ